MIILPRTYATVPFFSEIEEMLPSEIHGAHVFQVFLLIFADSR